MTITLGPDAEILLKKAVRERDASFKQVLNDAVRQGINRSNARPRRRYEPMTVDLGRSATRDFIANESDDV